MQKDLFKLKMDKLVEALNDGHLQVCAEHADKLVNALLADKLKDDEQLLWAFLYRHKAYYEINEAATDRIAIDAVLSAFHEQWFENNQNWRWIVSTSTEIAYRNHDLENLQTLAPIILSLNQDSEFYDKVLANLVMFYRGLGIEDEARRLEAQLNDSSKTPTSTPTSLQQDKENEETDTMTLLMSMGAGLEETLHEGDTESIQECLTMIIESINELLEVEVIAKNSLEYQFLIKKITLAYLDCLFREKQINFLTQLFKKHKNEKETSQGSLINLLSPKNPVIDALAIEGITQFELPGVELSHDMLRFTTYRALINGQESRDSMLSELRPVLNSIPDDPQGIEINAALWILGLFDFQLRADQVPISSEALREHSLIFEQTCRRLAISKESVTTITPPEWPDWVFDWNNLTGTLSDMRSPSS